MSVRAMAGLKAHEVVTSADVWLRAHIWDTEIVRLYKNAQLRRVQIEWIKQVPIFGIITLSILFGMNLLGMEVGAGVFFGGLLLTGMVMHIYGMQWEESDLSLVTPQWHYYANGMYMALPENVVVVVREALSHYPMAKFKVQHIGNDPIIDMIITGLPGVSGLRATICIWDYVGDDAVIIDRGSIS